MRISQSSVNTNTIVSFLFLRHRYLPFIKAGRFELAHPAKRGWVDSQFTYLLKMTCRCRALRYYCFYRHRTCHVFLKVCLRGNSDANRRDFCHHRLCFLPCLSPPFLQKIWIQNENPAAEAGRSSICKTRDRSLARMHLLTGKDRTQRERRCGENPVHERRNSLTQNV